MSDATVNPDEIATRARELIETDVTARVNAVRDIAEASNEYDAAAARFQDATAAHEESWKGALAAGWDEKQLRATGVRAPGAFAPKRRGRTPKNATPPAAES